MKIIYRNNETNIDNLTEIFEHGCFDKHLDLMYQVIDEEWISDELGNVTRIIKEAKLLKVGISDK